MTSSDFGWHPLAARAERLRTSRRLRSRPPAPSLTSPRR